MQKVPEDETQTPEQVSKDYDPESDDWVRYQEWFQEWGCDDWHEQASE